MLLRNTNASFSLYLSFLTHTHLKQGCHPFYPSLSLSVCLKDGSSILYVLAQHTLFPSVPPKEAINTFIEAYRREVALFTPIILSLTHSNSHSHFLTVRELEVRLHFQNPIPGTKWCPSHAATKCRNVETKCFVETLYSCFFLIQHHIFMQQQ